VVKKAWHPERCRKNFLNEKLSQGSGGFPEPAKASKKKFEKRSNQESTKTLQKQMCKKNGARNAGDPLPSKSNHDMKKSKKSICHKEGTKKNGCKWAPLGKRKTRILRANCGAAKGSRECQRK